MRTRITLRLENDRLSVGRLTLDDCTGHVAFLSFAALERIVALIMLLLLDVVHHCTLILTHSGSHSCWHCHTTWLHHVRLLELLHLLLDLRLHLLLH